MILCSCAALRTVSMKAEGDLLPQSIAYEMAVFLAS